LCFAVQQGGDNSSQQLRQCCELPKKRCFHVAGRKQSGWQAVPAAGLDCTAYMLCGSSSKNGAQPSIQATSMQVQMIMREASAVSPTGHAAAQVELFSTGAASQPAQALQVSLMICPLVQCWPTWQANQFCGEQGGAGSGRMHSRCRQAVLQAVPGETSRAAEQCMQAPSRPPLPGMGLAAPAAAAHSHRRRWKGRR
jgi:hypothetical protein